MSQLNKGDKVIRSAVLERPTISEEARTIEVAFSSEAEVDRGWGVEILSHDKGAIRAGRLSRGAAVLVDHDQTDQVGVVDTFSVDSDRKGRAVLRFGKSQRANEIFQDVKDGIRTNVSVGYLIHDLEELPDSRGIRVTDWEPFEISIVSVPADVEVGVGRSQESIQGDSDVLDSEAETPQQADSTETPTPPTTSGHSNPNQENKESPVDEVNTEATNKAAESARAEERTRVRTIQQMGRKFGMEKMSDEAVDNGVTVEQFRADLLGKLEAASPEASGRSNVITLDKIGASRDDVQKYSLMRAIQAQASGNWNKAGLEREISMAIATESGRDARGLFIPTEILAASREIAAGKGTGVSDPTGGAGLVGTDHRDDLFIDALRKRTLIGQLGAQMHYGLVGNVDIPKLLTDPTVNWIDENEDAPDSKATTGTVPLTPHTLTCATALTRRLMLQSSPAAETIIRNAILAQMGIGLDAALFGANDPGDTGSPTTKAPAGLLDWITNTVDLDETAPDWKKVVEMETAVREANVFGGNFAYVGTHAMEGLLKTTSKDTGSGMFLLENGNLNGYAFHGSNNLSKLTADTNIPMWFGAWNAIHVGFWGALDLVTDTATHAASGGIVLRAFQDSDLNIEHAKAFVRSKKPSGTYSAPQTQAVTSTRKNK